MVYTKLTEACTFAEFVGRLDEELKEAGERTVAERPSRVLDALVAGIEYLEHDLHPDLIFSFEQVKQAIKVFRGHQEEFDALVDVMELNHYNGKNFNLCEWVVDLLDDNADEADNYVIHCLWDFLTSDQQKYVVIQALNGLNGLDGEKNLPLERFEALFNVLNSDQKKGIVKVLNNDEGFF